MIVFPTPYSWSGWSVRRLLQWWRCPHFLLKPLKALPATAVIMQLLRRGFLDELILNEAQSPVFYYLPYTYCICSILIVRITFRPGVSIPTRILLGCWAGLSPLEPPRLYQPSTAFCIVRPYCTSLLLNKWMLSEYKVYSAGNLNNNIQVLT